MGLNVGVNFGAGMGMGMNMGFNMGLGNIMGANNSMPVGQPVPIPMRGNFWPPTK
jgi:hypothetical protein